MERFRALLLRSAYVLAEHLLKEPVLNLPRIDLQPAGRFVRLTRWSGTPLLDTGDRITFRGTAENASASRPFDHDPPIPWPTQDACAARAGG